MVPMSSKKNTKGGWVSMLIVQADHVFLIRSILRLTPSHRSAKVLHKNSLSSRWESSKAFEGKKKRKKTKIIGTIKSQSARTRKQSQVLACTFALVSKET